MKLHKGNLFDFEADVLVQGCNCLNTQGAGIAVEFVKRFRTDKFLYEEPQHYGKYNKLGTIDYGAFDLISKSIGVQMGKTGGVGIRHYADDILKHNVPNHAFIVNAYTQYLPGKDARYYALETCLWKVCKVFANKEIYVPMIGCGLGGLDPDKAMKIFEQYSLNVVQHGL